MEKVLTVAWKWTSFLLWLPWFFLTLPWQLKKGYARFIKATTFASISGERPVKYTICGTYFDNLN